MKKGNDFQNRLKNIIQEEVNNVLNEINYKYGTLVDPKNMDPNDPEVNIHNYGSMARSQLRVEITRRLGGALKTAKQAEGSESDKLYKNLESLFEPKGVLVSLIRAELDVSRQLEDLRTKGGRRTIPIPKQV
jgi:hypothetical protein|tara:strand:- start:463 stop:858 length:396 start_codon:yes stop_codon:yes gene_type:complete